MNQQLFDSMTDEEIVRYIRQGHKEGMEYLLDKYKELVRNRARSLYLMGGEREDLIQEGMIGLFKAIQGFDETKDASFQSFADLCVSRQMYTAVKAAQRKKHGPLNSYISLDSVTQDEDGSVRTNDALATDSGPEQMFIDRENVSQMRKKIAECLSPFEYQVMNYYLDGIGYVKIARMLGKSEKSVDNALQRIKTKIKKILN